MAIGEELANLNFTNMIGGPLNAVIHAQAQSAQTSVDFIKAVGFDETSKKPTMVDFTYDKTVMEDDGTGKTKPVVKAYKLTVPILTLLPIPFIRVEETTIDFNAKINAVQESTTTSSVDLNKTFTGKKGWPLASAELKVTFAYKRSTSSTNKKESTYSLSVHVRAVQDELPAGTDRLLGILESIIQETPADAKPT
jgi:hypothetical protein